MVPFLPSFSCSSDHIKPLRYHFLTLHKSHRVVLDNSIELTVTYLLHHHSNNTNRQSLFIAMSLGTQANPIPVLSPSESGSSDYESCIENLPSGTKGDPITLVSDSEGSRESSPAPISPLGSSKRPIEIDSESESEEEPPKKKRSPSPQPASLRLTLAIPEHSVKPPQLLHHYPAAATATSEVNFVAPTIDKSARVTALLGACPSLSVEPATLPAFEQIQQELRLAANRTATSSENGALLAWRSFAHASRGTRECMVLSGLDPDDLYDEAAGIENGLPGWKQPYTSE